VPQDDVFGPALAFGVMAIAVALGSWLWVDHRRRLLDLSTEDEFHFRRQEARRMVVTVVMLAIGVLLLAGTRIPPQVQRRPNMPFVATWVAILGLVVLLLVLAFLDWLATSRYARRQRQVITRAGMEILRDEFRRRARLRSLGGNGEGDVSTLEGDQDARPDRTS
jgi:hypothetical protein